MRFFLFAFYILDIIVVMLLGYTYALFFLKAELLEESLWLIAATGFLVNIVLSQLGGYRPLRARRLIDWVGPITGAVAISFVLLLLLLWVFKETATYSRAWLFIWFLSAYFSLLALRALAFILLKGMHQLGLHHRRLMVVGDHVSAQRIVSAIGKYPEFGYDLVDIWTNLDDASLCEKISNEKIQDVWITLPLSAELRIAQLLVVLKDCHVDIRYLPDLTGFSLLNHQSTTIMGLPMLDLSISPISDPINRFIKGVEDLVLGIVLAILMTPLILLIALLIKLSSPGPVFFTQRRGGFDGQEITVYKFRTMHLHDEVDGVITQATLNDDRVTPLGRLLRRTSMDELPQLLNVLQGRLSLVGPRPHALEHDAHFKELIANYALRYRVKPGITGWAQINGWRGEMNTLDKLEQRVIYDLYYVENWSLYFDIKIILMTIVQVIRGKNAY